MITSSAGVRSWKRRRPSASGRQRRRDVEQVFVAQPDEGTAHQGAERQRVQRICKGADEDEDVLQLLAPEQCVTRLGCHRDAAPFKGALIPPQIRMCGREQSNVARAEESLRPIRFGDRERADQARAQVRDGRSFRLPLFLGACVTRNINRQLRCGGKGKRRQAKGRSERYKAGLPRLSEDILEHAVDVVDNLRT